MMQTEPSHICLCRLWCELPRLVQRAKPRWRRAPGIRGFLGHVATVASLAAPVGVARTTVGIGIYGLARFASSSVKFFANWKQVRQARAALEGSKFAPDAETVALAIEK